MTGISFILDWIHIILFIDIFIQMNTIYFDKGEQVARFSQIFKRFMRKQFIFDLLCCLNFFLVVYKTILKNEYADWIDYCQLPLALMWARRIDRIEKILTDYLQLSEYATYLFKIGKLLVLVLLIAHWMACIWFLILQLDPQGGSFYNDDLIDPQNLENIYMVTIYWVITVMATVGFGEFSPQSTIQRIASIALILFSTVVFAYTVNTIGEIYDERQQMDNLKKIKLVELNEYLNDKNVNRELSARVNSFMEYAITNLGKFENNSMKQLELLKVDIRDRALSKIHLPALLNISILKKDFSVEFLNNIARIVTVHVAKPMEEILDVGDCHEGRNLRSEQEPLLHFRRQRRNLHQEDKHHAQKTEGRL